MALNEYVKNVSFKPSLDEKAEKETKNKINKLAKDLEKSLSKSLTKTFDFLLDGIKSTLENSIKELNNILEYSQLSSAKTRELTFGYGFSSSQAYGFEKALEQVGLQGEEDLFYANNQELKQFRQAFEKYSNYYSELYSSGFFEKLQDYQFEMADFKNEMQMQVITFFMENKEGIKAGMQAVLDISKVILNIFTALTRFFGQSSNVATTSDIVNKYNITGATSKNTNVNVNNTFNGVAKEDETWLANAGALTYEQVIRMLGGD